MTPRQLKIATDLLGRLAEGVEDAKKRKRQVVTVAYRNPEESSCFGAVLDLVNGTEWKGRVSWMPASQGHGVFGSISLSVEPRMTRQRCNGCDGRGYIEFPVAVGAPAGPDDAEAGQ